MLFSLFLFFFGGGGQTGLVHNLLMHIPILGSSKIFL